MLMFDRKLKGGTMRTGCSLYLIRLSLFYSVWKAVEMETSATGLPESFHCFLSQHWWGHSGASYVRGALRRVWKPSLAPGLRNLSYKVSALPDGCQRSFWSLRRAQNPDAIPATCSGLWSITQMGAETDYSMAGDWGAGRWGSSRPGQGKSEKSPRMTAVRGAKLLLLQTGVVKKWFSACLPISLQKNEDGRCFLYSTHSYHLQGVCTGFLSSPECHPGTNVMPSKLCASVHSSYSFLMPSYCWSYFET